jgi:hypothetical protein
MIASALKARTDLLLVPSPPLPTLHFLGCSSSSTGDQRVEVSCPLISREGKGRPAEMCELSELCELSPQDAVESLCVKGVMGGVKSGMAHFLKRRRD